MRLDYATIKEEIVLRIRQPEILTGTVEGTLDLPVFQESFVDRCILRVVHQLLLSITSDEWDALGADAVEALTLANGDTMPLNVTRILSAAIDGVQTEPVSEVSWHQRGLSSVQNNIWTIEGGLIKFLGTQIVLQVIKESSLTDLQSDSVILPEGYDAIVIDKACRWLEFADDMEYGRS